MVENKPNSQEPAIKATNDRGWWKPGLAVFGEVTGWIVIPIVLALYFGKYLDEQQGTTNLFFLSFTGIAFIISCTGIGYIGSNYIKQIEASNTKKNKK